MRLDDYGICLSYPVDIDGFYHSNMGFNKPIQADTLEFGFCYLWYNTQNVMAVKMSPHKHLETLGATYPTPIKNSDDIRRELLLFYKFLMAIMKLDAHPGLLRILDKLP